MIDVAKIVKPQGIKGEVKAQPLTNVLAVFENLKKINVDGEEKNIQKLTLRQGFLYIKFEDINDRNAAESLRNKPLFVSKATLSSHLQEDEILVDDIVGTILFDTEGNLVGQVVDVENYGATFNFIIQKDGRTIQTPFVVGLFEKDGDILKVNRKKFDEVSV